MHPPAMQLARAAAGGQLHSAASSCAPNIPRPTSPLQPQCKAGGRRMRGCDGTTKETWPAGMLGSPVTLTANLRSRDCVRA